MKQHLASAGRTMLTWVRQHPLTPPGRHGLMLGVAAFTALAVGAGGGLLWDRLNAVPPGAALRVNSTVIRQEQIDEQAKLMMALTGQPAPDQRLLAKDAAVSQVLEDAGKERNIVIADKAANDRLTEWLERAYPPGRDQFIAQLNKAGVSEATVVRGMRLAMLRERLFAEVTKNVPPPTDQDVDQTYAQHKAELTVPEQRHVRNIVLPDKATADQALLRINQGQDFATVAKEMSIDTQTKVNGGDLGSATREEITDKAFADAVFAAAPNSVFGPTQTQAGSWCVGQVLEVTPPSLPPLAQVRDQVRAQVFQVHKIDAFNKWVSELLHDATIRYAPAYLPADPYGISTLPSALTGSEAAPK